jgi:hypothetical protein
LEVLKLLEAVGMDSSFPMSQSIPNLDSWNKSSRCLKISASFWAGSKLVAMQQSLPLLSFSRGVREVWAAILGRVERIYTMGFLYATAPPPPYWFDK